MSLRQTLASLPREARDTLFTLVVIAWVIAPQTDVLPLWTSGLAAGLLLWRGGLAWTGRPLPSPWLLRLLLVLAVAGTLLTHRTILGRDAGLTLIVSLLALKTLETRARRDAFVIFFLGFFTMLSNFFYSQSLLTAAAMLIALLGLLTALVNAHVPVGRPPLTQSLRTAATLALLGAPIMAALFMFFPRMAPLWGMPGDTLAGRSGLSGSMRVGSIAELALDERIALRLRFDDPKTNLPQSMLYFRGPVLSSFDGREWLADPVRDDSSATSRMGLPANLEVQGEPLRYEVTLEAHQRPWLLMLEASRLKPEIPGMFVFMTQDLQWLTSRPITDVLRFNTESHPQFRHGPTTATPQLRALTRLPQGSNPRTLELARQMQADPRLAAGGPQAYIDDALQRLRTGGYTYTLEPGVYGEHTADEFWFDRKAGFCEHIASSFVVLMRALGVPARIVTGYQGGERNAIDGYWTVRQSDAHAWSEVWIEGRGWVRVDPTGAVSPGRVGQFQRLQAPRGVLANAMGTVMSPDMAQRLRAVWEAANNRWNQWVLNYTQSRQLDLLRALGFNAPDWQDLARVLAGLVVATAVGGALWTLWERLQHDPWLRLLAQARARLARAGLQLPASSPPRTLAEQARARFGSEADDAAAWLLRLEQWRYAPETPSRGLALGQLRRELRQLRWPAPGPST
ncbi:transglutaminase family protein [Simplicispira lacusdiani]|uniref:transglutaminase family protein n=1 Tax=Simplicispira lacusdiani TaxID=2213010 RepID=UPI000E723EA4|nr:DUF3488 and transglutaminase-like domain-containing protein [Simplicispira lacusdiani]